ncbi:MAG: glycosyltransferase family 4 protein, partial [Candidatus Binataceae bacterium]
MEMQSWTFLAVPLVAFVLAASGLPLAKRLATRYGIVATPYSDSRHSAPTPLLGGAAIVVAVLAAMAVAGALPLWMLVGAAGLFAVGLVDDSIVLKPLRKFLMQLAVVVFVVAVAPGFGLLPWPLLAAALAVFWLVSTVNAFNLADGLDGLAGGVGIVAALAVTTIGLMRHDLAVAYQGLAIAGALGGFLIHNLHPASIFMGDCGALPLGLLLGITALHAGGLAAAHSRLSRYVVPILIMLMPLLDTAIVSVSRMATGIPVSRRGLDHSHHRLLVLGLSDERAVAVCWGIALASGLCAVALAVMPHAYVIALLPFIAVTFALVGLFMIDLTFDSNPPGIAYGRLQWLARLILSFSYKRRAAEAALDLV